MVSFMETRIIYHNLPKMDGMSVELRQIPVYVDILIKIASI